jgi:uncharacterized linocin/CFP29 family protein
MIQTEKPLSTLVSEFADLTEQRRKLEVEVKKLATDLAAREEKLVEGFAQAGIQNIKTATGQTIYLNREIFAKLVGDQKKALTAFRRAGLGDFVKETVNANTLRAWVREMDEVLPKGLQPYIDVTEVFRMRMRSN